MYNENKRGIADDQFAIATDSRPIDFLPLLVRFFFLIFSLLSLHDEMYTSPTVCLLSFFFPLSFLFFPFRGLNSLYVMFLFLFIYFFSRFMEKWAQFYSIIMIVL